MLEREFSQLPVIRTDNKKLVGYVSLTTLQERLDQGAIQPKTAVQDCMFTFKKSTGTLKYQLITPDTSLADLGKLYTICMMMILLLMTFVFPQQPNSLKRTHLLW